MNEKRKSNMDSGRIYLMQLLFAAGITIGSGSLELENKHKWTVCIARYVVYVLTIQAVKAISVLIFDLVKSQRGLDIDLIVNSNKNQLMMFIAAVAMVYLNDQKLYMEDFLLIFMANLIISYQSIIETTPTNVMVTYGSGMAASYVEGYLVHVIPSDGGKFKGFLDNVHYIEAKQGVVFPVKKLFIISTKTMYCPPDLNEFNDQTDRDDVSRLEACQSFREVIKDVAGVKGRYYKNSAYKINRPNKRPVYIAAECATSIHTLYKVLKNRELYEELAAIDPDVVVKEFMETLASILRKSPDLKNKCELIFFDDTNPNLNLADVLLDRIRELEPKFEEFINRKN